MSTADWIVVGVGAAQALFLAIAAFFAWRAYVLARAQRRDSLKELRTSEDRRLLQSVVEEVMSLARDAEELVAGNRRTDLIEGDLQRLRFALAFAPMRLD